VTRTSSADALPFEVDLQEGFVNEFPNKAERFAAADSEHVD
jgi:hypothetical protein